jgi:5-carboxymethyl-2-hydroxymuconate isomerase
MPHVVVQYSANLESGVDMPALCRDIADVLIEQKDKAGGPLFPPGGTRVLAYPSRVYAVADGADDYGFCYVNIRVAAGRSLESLKRSGDAVLGKVQARFADCFARKHVGVTIQIDESGPGQVYDAKHSNLHALFNK